MKSVKIYLRLLLMPAALVMAASLWSCEGFLKEEAQSQREMDKFYNNKTELEAGLLGVYAQAKSNYTGTSLPITILGTDELYSSNTSGNPSTADCYLYPANHTTTTNWYQTHYKVIQSANIIINRAPGVPEISDEDRNMIIAEARVIRAWSYFRLVQTLGRVPLIMEETTNFYFRISRAPIADVYQAIIEDLSLAAEEGVLSKNKITGRINHWVAKGLLAKVYLTLGTSMIRRPQPIDEYRELPYDPVELFRDCRTLCDQIRTSGKYFLADVYGDIFMLSKKNGVESLWELQFSDSPKMGSEWSKMFGLAQSQNSNAYTINCMVGRGTYCPLPSFYRYFKLGDVRRTWSIADYRVEFNKTTLEPSGQLPIAEETISDVTSEKCNLDTEDPDSLSRSLNSIPAARLRVSKYRWSYGTDPSLFWKETMSFESGNAPNNVIVLRYADILLMRIESDMLASQGVASTTSLDIMNKELLARARGWNSAAGRYVTEQEMLDNVLAPYKTRVDNAQAAVDLAPDSETAKANLAAAKKTYDQKKARCMVNYTAETLTYDELMTQRACELCFEFHRWFDLSRTAKLHTLVPARVVNPNAIPRVSFRFDVNYLMPIPTYELDLAKDKTLFYQNPGY